MRNLVIPPLFALLAASAFSPDKFQERLQECGTVMEEILDMPDSIPTDLLHKAECVLVMPSVKKFALGIGGSYGAGAMVCRSGDDFLGPWGPPALYRLDGGNIGFLDRGPGDRLHFPGDELPGCQRFVEEQGQAGSRCLGGSRPQGPCHRSGDRRLDARRDSHLLASARPLRGSIPGRRQPSPRR